MILSPRQTRTALEMLRQNKSIYSNPFYKLVWVQEHLMHGAPYVSIASVDHVVSDLIVTVLTEQLNFYRHIEELAPAALIQRRQQAIDSFVDDFNTSNEKLKAWSFLYFRYARVDLALQVTTLAKLASLSRRHLQRVADDGFYYLTQHISIEEEAARATAWPEWLELKLPDLNSEDLVGQDNTLRQLETMLLASETGVQLAGLRGSGKTVLAKVVVNRLIHRGAIDDVVWIELDHLHSPDDLFDKLSSMVGFPGLATHVDRSAAALHVSRYVIDNRILLVIDNAHFIEGGTQSIDDLVSLGFYRLLLISPYPYERHFPRLNMPPIESSTAFYNLLKTTCRRLHISQRYPLTIPQAEAIYHVVDGHPGTAKVIIYHLKILSADELIANIAQLQRRDGELFSRYIFHEAWYRLSVVAQHLVYHLFWTEKDLHTYADIMQVPGRELVTCLHALETLVDFGILANTSDGYRITTWASYFLQSHPNLKDIPIRSNLLPFAANENGSSPNK